MAQGDFTQFEEFSKDVLNYEHNFGSGVPHVYKIALITTLPVATQLTPRLGDYTEVSGSNYTAGGITLTMVVAEVGGVATVSISNTSPTALWTNHASGPNNIKAGLLYNSTTTNKAAFGFVDFTEDAGTTAISLQDGDVEWDVTEATNRIFTLTVN